MERDADRRLVREHLDLSGETTRFQDALATGDQAAVAAAGATPEE